jgi:peroxiredoxin (alkyl hydroperoxide reductase subunit C)
MIVPGTKLPPFETVACVGVEPGSEFGSVTSTDFPGKWLVLYTYPKDFTFVCPTEIVEFDQKLAAFAERGAVVLGASTDNEHAHLAWRREHPELRDLEHPLLFLNPAMAESLGVLHPGAGVAVRATFIVDPERVVRFSSANDLDVGRNVDEVLRVLDGLQTGELVACSWKKGQATLTQEGKKALKKAS